MMATTGRHATRLETLGRTVKHIPHTLFSNTSSNDRDRHHPQRSSSPHCAQSARLVSLAFKLRSSVSCSAKTGSPPWRRTTTTTSSTQRGTIHMAASTSHFRSHTCWIQHMHMSPSTLLLLIYSDGLQLWVATNLDAVRELAHFPAIGRLSSATILSRPNARDNDHTLLLMLLGAISSTQLHVYSLASHSTIHRYAVPHATSIQASSSFIIVSTSHPSPALHVFSSIIPEFPLHVLPMSQIPNPMLHYQVVCSYTRRPLRHPRQPTQTNTPMQPRILDQPQRPWRLWTRQSRRR
jgi:hypothetical protein